MLDCNLKVIENRVYKNLRFCEKIIILTYEKLLQKLWAPIRTPFSAPQKGEIEYGFKIIKYKILARFKKTPFSGFWPPRAKPIREIQIETKM